MAEQAVMQKEASMENKTVLGDLTYVSLTEASIRFHLLHELSVIVHELLYDDVYSREEGARDLLKVMHTIKIDLPVLPTPEDIGA